MRTALLTVGALFAALLAGCGGVSQSELSEIQTSSKRSEVEAVLGSPIESHIIRGVTFQLYSYDRTDPYEVQRVADPMAAFAMPILALLAQEASRKKRFVAISYTPEGEIDNYLTDPDKTTVLETIEACSLPFSKAEQLNASAQYELGVICPSMRSDPQTDPIRWQWMCLAANQQIGQVQQILGWFYSQDDGPVSYNLIEAYQWAKLATENGFGKSRSDTIKTRLGWKCCEYRPSVDQLAKKMTPGQIAEAERLVAEWEPNLAECEIEAAQAEK
jgi:hypothetical protein